MPASASFVNELDILDQALNAVVENKRLVLKFETKNEAYSFRMRLYAARQRVLRENRRAFGAEDPRGASTPYHRLCILLKESEGKWNVILQNGMTKPSEILVEETE